MRLDVVSWWFDWNFLCAINWYNPKGELIAEGGYVYEGLLSAYLMAVGQLGDLDVGYHFTIMCHATGFMV